jgi:hypothetical protein
MLLDVLALETTHRFRCTYLPFIAVDKHRVVVLVEQYLHNVVHNGLWSPDTWVLICNECNSMMGNSTVFYKILVALFIWLLDKSTTSRMSAGGRSGSWKGLSYMMVFKPSAFSAGRFDGRGNELR